MISCRPGKVLAASLTAAALALALAGVPGAPAGRPEALAAPPVPSTGAPPSTGPMVRASGMTLEMRRGRIVVTEVAEGSPADRAGVLPLDVLLVVNGRSLIDLDPVSPGQVAGLLRDGRKPGTRIVLGRGAGTLAVDLPRDQEESRPAPAAPGELRPGMQAPLFTAIDLHGKDVSLEGLRKRLVLLDFWASTCLPCVKNVIPLRRIAEEYSGRLTIVGVSLDEDRPAFEAFAYNRHLPGIQIFDGGGWHGPIGRLYGVAATGIPRYVLVGADGRIVAIKPLEEIEDDIARLAPPAPAL